MIALHNNNVQVTIFGTCLNFAGTGSRILLHSLSSCRRVIPLRKFTLNLSGGSKLPGTSSEALFVSINVSFNCENCITCHGILSFSRHGAISLVNKQKEYFHILQVFQNFLLRCMIRSCVIRSLYVDTALNIALWLCAHHCVAQWHLAGHIALVQTLANHLHVSLKHKKETSFIDWSFNKIG